MSPYKYMLMSAVDCITPPFRSAITSQQCGIDPSPPNLFPPFPRGNSFSSSEARYYFILRCSQHPSEERMPPVTIRLVTYGLRVREQMSLLSPIITHIHSFNLLIFLTNFFSKKVGSVVILCIVFCS